MKGLAKAGLECKKNKTRSSFLAMIPFCYVGLTLPYDSITRSHPFALAHQIKKAF
jgi:hypothetical protein